MKTLYSFLILFIISFNASSQETNDSLINKQSIITEVNPGVLLGVAPLAIIDVFDAPSIRLSVEVPISQRIALGIEGGFVFYESMYKEKPGGFIIKPVIKYYLNPKGDVKRYFAFEYMFKEQHYYLTDSLKINDVRYKKTYNMKRKAVAFTLKYGQVFKWKGVFDIDWFVGAGIRFQNSVSELTPEEERSVLTGLDSETGTDHGDSEVAIMQRQSGRFVYPNVTAGLKLIFSFSRFKKT